VVFFLRTIVGIGVFISWWSWMQTINVVIYCLPLTKCRQSLYMRVKNKNNWGLLYTEKISGRETGRLLTSIWLSLFPSTAMLRVWCRPTSHCKTLNESWTSHTRLACPLGTKTRGPLRHFWCRDINFACCFVQMAGSIHRPHWNLHFHWCHPGLCRTLLCLRE